MPKVILIPVRGGTLIRCVEKEDGEVYEVTIQKLDKYSLDMLQMIFNTEEIDEEIRRTTPIPSPFKFKR